MNRWIKLTLEQAATLTALNQTNTGNNFIQARPDAAGNPWICADVLMERAGLYAYYGEWLDTLGATQAEEPVWPVENL